MDNLADLEKAYRVPCKHCAKPMQAWDLFCPSCGKDQTTAKAAVPAQPAAAEPEPHTPVAPPAPLALLEPPAPTAGEAPMAAALLPPPAGAPTTRARILIGIGAALLVLLGGVLVHDHLVVDRQPPAENVEQREFKAHVEQLQGALNRGELDNAARLLDLLEARHLSDPAVQELRMAFDRRTQEQADMRERLRQAAAAKPLAAVPPAPPAPPAPPKNVAPPPEKVCNETLAALALCSNR